jgi:hypothetical protein
MQFIKVDWTEFKGYVDNLTLKIQYLENTETYRLYTFNGQFQLECMLEKGSTDATDFETNYKSDANTREIDSDQDGRSIQRAAATYKGWRYLAHPIEVTTSKLNGCYSSNWEGIARTDCTIKYYNDQDVELTAGTQAELDTDCVKTVITLAPSHDYDIIGGNIHQHTTPTQDVRIWVIAGATDLAYLPGTVTEFVGGLNFKYITEGSSIETDGRASARLNLTTTGVPVPTNKMQYIFRHPVGFQHDLMIVVEYFRS